MSAFPIPIVGTRSGPDLVCLGNLLVDDIVYPDGRTRMGEAGGAAIYVSLAARLWGVSVGVVSVRGDDYPAAMLAGLETRGVDLRGVRELGRPGLRTWLLYENKLRRVVHHLNAARHVDVSPESGDIPAAYRDTGAFHLSPMPFDVQRRLVDELSQRRGSALSIDPHESIREDNLGAWREVLGHVDAFFPSEDEMRLDGYDEDPQRTIRRLAGGRLRFIAMKRGAAGGLLYDSRADVFVE